MGKLLTHNRLPLPGTRGQNMTNSVVNGNGPPRATILKCVGEYAEQPITPPRSDSVRMAGILEARLGCEVARRPSTSEKVLRVVRGRFAYAPPPPAPGHGHGWVPGRSPQRRRLATPASRTTPPYLAPRPRRRDSALARYSAQRFRPDLPAANFTAWQKGEVGALPLGTRMGYVGGLEGYAGVPSHS